MYNLRFADSVVKFRSEPLTNGKEFKGFGKNSYHLRQRVAKVKRAVVFLEAFSKSDQGKAKETMRRMTRWLAQIKFLVMLETRKIRLNANMPQRLINLSLGEKSQSLPLAKNLHGRNQYKFPTVKFLLNYNLVVLRYEK